MTEKTALLPSFEMDMNCDTRRDFLLNFGLGIGSLALSNLLSSRDARAASPDGPRARAKRLIFLYMDGGPSQMDTFDPKPRLTLDHDKPMPFQIDGRFATQKIMKCPYSFAQHGQSGAWVSDIFPNLAGCVDDLAFIRSMVSKSSEHPVANYLLSTGFINRGRPSMGSWLSYGLGHESKNLPAYMVLHAGDMPQGGSEIFSPGFLPSRHQPWMVNHLDDPTKDMLPTDQDVESQKRIVSVVQSLDRLATKRFVAHDEFDAHIENYERAFRLQTAFPEWLDITKESAATQALYGINDEPTRPFGTQCLLARRLIERGVSCITLLPPTAPGANRWDQHDTLVRDLRINAQYVDKPIAGLLRDLKTLGLLNETLVLFGGEFGRTPTAEDRPGKELGRDHNPYGFTVWMAGGGIKGGTTYGATDEFGYKAIENPVTIHDLHATILHLMGIDHEKLTYKYAGRDFRLTDVFGSVVKDIIA